MTSIAFLGTGLLGGAFVEAALKRGDQVTVWNRTSAKAHALEGFGARVAATPAEAARGAARVHLVLRDDAVVDDVIAQLRPGLDADAIIIDHTTTLPALTAARSRRLNSEGVRYLHCPVFIGPAAAREGKGAIMVCGPRTLFDAVRPGLEQQAGQVRYLGERPDVAAVFKLCGNAYTIGIAALVADVFTIAAAEDVPPIDTMMVLDFIDPRAVITGRGKRMAAEDFSPTFELTMARKDVQLMVDAAAGAPLAVLPGLVERMDAMIAQGHGADDLGILVYSAKR
jgi:3-hydroxyisobutyrate dehydrogenase-like beta-hydroxyacid dehydrogenase